MGAFFGRDSLKVDCGRGTETKNGVGSGSVEEAFFVRPTGAVFEIIRKWARLLLFKRL